MVESAFIAVEVLPVGSKPSAVIGERIAKGERQDLGAAAPLSTRALSIEQESAGRPMQSSPEPAEPFESGSTRFAKTPSPCIV